MTAAVIPLRPAVTLGGSSAAAAAGIDRYRSRAMLWAELTGRVERAESEAMRWGKLLEPLVLAELVERGYSVSLPAHDHYRDAQYPWLVGHPDGFTDGRLLEVKTASPWSPAAQDDAPIEYVAQCQVYMHLTGTDAALLAVLVGGQRLELREVERDDRAIALLLDRMAEFVGYVERDEPPPFEGHPDEREVVAILYPSAEPGKLVRETREVREARHELRMLLDSEKALKAQIEAQRAVLTAFMGDAETLIDARDETVATFRNVTARRCDTTLLRKESPELWEAYASETTTRRLVLT